MIRGIPIEMGGAEFIVPPLTVGHVRDLRAERETVSKDDADEAATIQAGALIVLAALQRNYPEMTIERVTDELLDLGNFREVLTAVLTGSGLKPAVSGEVVAATRIGSASTGSSPSPADTGPATSTS